MLTLRSPSVLAPFIIFAALQFLVLVCLSAFSVSPLSTVMVPVVAGLGGEEALHYPMHMVMLPRLYHQLYLPLTVFVGFALFGWGVWLMMDHYVRAGEDVPRRGQRQFRKLIPSTMVVGFVFVAVVTAIQLISSVVSAALANVWAERVAWVGGVALVIAFQALTIYSLYFLVTRTNNPLTAIAESVRFGRSHFGMTSALVLTVFLIHLPINYLAQRADRVVLKFNPELVFVLLAVGIVLEIATNYFLFASTTSVAADVKAGGYLMPGSRRMVLALAGLVLVTAGCRSHEEVHARYTLERLSWRAQVQERKINIAFIKASQRDLALAIERLNDVVAYDPLTQYDASDWDPRVVRDIRRIRLASRIALANLYFLSERYQEAGDFYARTLKDATIDFKRQLTVRLSLVRTVYLTGETDLLEEQCAAIFEEIDQSEDFWSGKFALQDVFLGIPLVLTRLYAEREDRDRYREFSDTAERFYTRVAQTWPDDVIAAKALYSRVMIHLQREKWNAALSDIDLLMGNDNFKNQRGQLLLLKGEILTYALEDIPEGEAVFNRLMETYPGTAASYAAQFNLASLRLNDGDEREGFELLRELEGGDRVPAEVAAKAMLTRALYLEKEDRWDEALPLFRRLVRLFPNTEQAVEAPLVVTRHYLATGELQLAKRNLDRATDYYGSLLERQSKYRGDRLLVEDFLIENYLAMNKGKEIVDLLEKRSRDWDEVSSAGAYLKSAVIYSAVLEDDENAVRVLKKSIELFPRTRYAKIAQQRLDQMTEGTNK